LNIASLNRKQQAKYLINKYASETSDKFDDDSNAFDEYQREKESENRNKSNSDSQSSSETSDEQEPSEQKLQVS
jgi:hypothetical protein